MKKAPLLLFLIGMFASLSARADAGPKPTMRFNITYEGSRAAGFVKLIQLQFDSATATVPQDSLHDANHRGPEGLRCNSPQECRSLAYGYRPYHKLMFVFADDTLYSPMFDRQAFNSTYDVTVTDAGVTIKNTTPWFFREDSPYAFFRSLTITLVVEIGGLWLVLLLFKYPQKKRFLLVALLANLISLPVFWFGIMGVMNSTAGWWLGELFVLVFETFFIWYFMGRATPLGRMTLLVVFLNFLSMLAGGAALFLMLILS